jgi:uncharacterized membrane protein
VQARSAAATRRRARPDQLRRDLRLVALTRWGAPLTGYALTLIAFAFSVYLAYRELFTIHAICSWCVSSAIVFTLLAIVGSRRVFHLSYARAGAAAAYA